MRWEDLIPAFVAELEWLVGDSATAAQAKLIAEANELCEKDESEIDEDEPDQILEALFDTLGEFAPAYGYFGAHPGDGSDFGFWLYEGWDEDFDGLKVSDTSEVPDDYAGEVLHVNDHGNCTLYAKDHGATELREIWSIV